MKNTTKTAALHFWVRTPSDARDCAGSTGRLTVPQGVAVRLAKEVNVFGRAAFRGDLAQYAPSLPVGNQVVSGHGVTVRYESGRLRHILNGET